MTIGGPKSKLVQYYEGKARWWYDAIADWMIRNPNKTLKDCAAELGKHYNTILAITGTDSYRAHFAARKREWREQHDNVIMSKTLDIAALGLDLIHEHMKVKRNAIPLNLLVQTTGDALDRLGFGAKHAPAVQVNNNFGDQSQKTFVAVTANELEEAREALRRAERARLVEPTTPQLIEHHKEASSEPLPAD